MWQKKLGEKKSVQWSFDKLKILQKKQNISSFIHHTFPHFKKPLQNSALGFFVLFFCFSLHLFACWLLLPMKFFFGAETEIWAKLSKT